MKKIILFLFLSLSINIFAQKANTAELSKQVKKEIAILKSILNITDMQATRIAPVFTQAEAQVLRASKAVNGNKETLAVMLKEIHDAKIKNIKGGLTEEQVKLFDKLQLEAKF